MKKLLTALAALLAAACGDILETDISGKRVSAVAPVDKTEIAEGSVSFLCNLLEGADRYRITIVSPAFENAAAVVRDTIIVPDSLAASFGFRIRLSEGNYQWSTQAFNEAYESVRSVYDLKVTAKEDTGEPDGAETETGRR